MFRSKHLHSTLAVLLGAFASVQAAPPSAAEIDEATEWFRELPIPNTKGKPYVEIVELGPPGARDDLQEAPVRGFLLSEDTFDWTIFCDGSVTPHSPDGPLHWPFSTCRISKGVTIRTLPLHEAVRDLLATPPEPSNIHQKSDRIVGQFILARLCEYNGEKELAKKLDNSLPPIPGRVSLKLHAEETIARVRNWQAVLNLQSAPRSELLEQFQFIEKHFADSSYANSASQYVKSLSRLIAEDEAHKAKPVSEMTPEEQAGEYIFRLRDQTGYQNGKSRRCEIFGGVLGAASGSPADSLTRLGHVAVPALIAALEDDRLTRAVELGRDFNDRHRVLTIGECAEQILSQIAARHFSRDPKERDKEIQKWWRRTQTIGERSTLIEMVQEGEASMKQAEQLMAMDPAAAVAALGEGLRNAPHMQVFFVPVLKDCHHPSATELLKRHVSEGTAPLARVMAARYLHERGDPAGLAAILAEWDAWLPQDHGDMFGLDFSGGGVITALIWCGDLQGIEALATRFDEMPPSVRLRILDELRRSHSNEPGKAGVVHSKEASARIEELLLHALKDPTTEGKRPIRHVAGASLIERWPDRYRPKPAPAADLEPIQKSLGK